MAYISNALRQLVAARAHGLCEYCQTAQTIVIEIEIDHIVPEAAGGATEADNLCLACISCNTFKSAYQTGIDPHTDEEVLLFNPRQQQWDEHFRWGEDGSQIIGTTAIGRVTVARLQMNRSLAVQARQRWVQAGWHPPKTTETKQTSSARLPTIPMATSLMKASSPLSVPHALITQDHLEVFCAEKDARRAWLEAAGFFVEDSSGRQGKGDMLYSSPHQAIR